MDYKKIKKSIENNIVYTFARSGGHGGQNVNKVNTKVHATLSVEKIDGVTESERSILQIKLKNIINSENKLFVDVQEERYQSLNKTISIEKLENMIIRALKTNRERIKTSVPEIAITKRLDEKKRRSEIKKMRVNRTLFF